MVRPKKDPARVASLAVTARLTVAEHAALAALIERRAADMEARSEPGDASFAGWLRSVIRREAKAAGIALAMPAALAVAKKGAKRTARKP